MKRKAALFLLAVALAAMAWDARGLAEDTDDGLIYNFDGRVSIIRRQKTVLPEPDLPLVKSDSIVTEADGFADIILQHLVGVRFSADTECVIASQSRGEMRLKLLKGSALVNAKPLPNGTNFFIETDSALAKIRGPMKTQFYVKVVPKSGYTLSSIASRKGDIDVTVKKSSSTVTLAQGQSVDVKTNDFIPPVRATNEEEWLAMDRASSVYIAEK